MLKVSIFLATITMCALFIVGCGGGSSKLDRSGTGSLYYGDMNYVDTTKYVDMVSATAENDGYVAVEMNKATSNSISDPAVRVVRGHCITASQYNTSFNTYGLLAYDDDSGEGTNARAVFHVTKGDEFTVAFTSYSSGDVGDYSWNIYETDSRSQMGKTSSDSNVQKAPLLDKDGLIAE